VGKSGLGVRGDAILEFDYSVGAVMDKLVELGIADNTIVLLTSDNGPVIDDGYADKAVQLLGDHNPMGLYRGGKYSSFEAGTRVPMIIRWPAAIKNGQKSDAPVSQIDYMSTVGALIGGMIPSDADIDSRNAISTFTGRDKKGREYIIEQTGSVISILYRNWKFIPASNGPRYGELTNTEYGNTPVDKLYDLSYDHGEKINVAKHHPEIIKRLKKLLNNELEKGNSYNLKY
jgi:arylsulfatase A-like enzyme